MTNADLAKSLRSATVQTLTCAAARYWAPTGSRKGAKAKPVRIRRCPATVKPP